ncbi:NAD(P) transhydrogenase subunit alpha [Proteiniborus sp.]|uniref:NAD(P) transhydrogenase subunit alpha n=1 Tax=Proteiniborus sp. TaxID=2079015 RepID=UPI00331A642A
MGNAQFKGLTIGVPKEIMKGEKRVSATPETVEKMVQNGATVLVEKGAGINSLMPDSDYEKVGAKIIADVQELFNQSDIILKVKEPVFNSEIGKHEVDMLKKGQILITFLHPAAPKNHNMIKSLAKSGATSLTLDGIPRISRAQTMDALTSMSCVAGYKSVLLAANKLAKFVPMTGTAVGMIQPSKVVVIGTGVAGLQAVSTAKRLGAVVTAVDIRPDAIEHSKSLGAKVLDPGVPAEVAIGKGGYAKSLPVEWIEKEREAVRDLIIDADIVIATALVPGKLAPVVITEEMVKSMRPGSVIMDVAIDQGGNCELSESGVIAEHYGVTVDGTNNIPGMMASSSTWMFSKNIYNLVAAFVKDGQFIIDREDEIIASTLVTMDGELLHQGAREAMGLK